MAEVPRIVRECLRDQAVAGEHPDANLLSAFAERALTGRERAQVLDHISRCADCREVVALSAPSQVEEEQLVAAAAARAQGASRSWWRSPVIHWGALTAAALVVLIAVGERMRLRQEYSASAPAITSTQLTPAPAASQTQQEELQNQTDAAQARRHSETPNRSQAAGVGGNRVVSNRPVLAGSAAAPAAPPAPPPESKKLQSPVVSDYSGGQPPDQARKIDQPQLKALPAPSMAAKAASEATQPAGAEAGRPVQPALSAQGGANFTRRAFLGPRWSVSNSGAVQRSFDGGRSWNEVPIVEGVSFRAVAVVVNDVWAGGSGGALFHSADGGEHWTRVGVQGRSRTLSGDITRIEVADARNLAVTTSAGETWTSSDAGATWRLQ